MKTGRVRVTVVDRGSDLPLENAHVGVFLLERVEAQSIMDHRGARLLEAHTDEHGLCVIESELSATMEVEVVARAPGHSEWRSNRLKSSRAPTDSPPPPRLLTPDGELEVRAKLEAGTTLAGRITDEAGQPVADVHVGLVLSTPTSCSWPHAFGVTADVRWPPPCTTGQDGTFEWLSFPARLASQGHDSQFVLVFQHSRLAPAMAMRVESLPPDEQGVIRVDAVMPTGVPLEGVVRLQGGGATAGARVNAVAAPLAGQPVCVRFTKYAETDADGRFALAGLPPLAHDVSVEREGCAPHHSDADLSAAHVGALEIELHPGTALHGTILTKDGSGLPDAEVRAFTREPFVSRETRTDADGAFTLEGLPASGEVELSCWPGLQVTIDLPSAPVTLHMPAPATLEVVLVSEETGERMHEGHVAVQGPGFSTIMQPDEDGALRRQGLPTGQYTLKTVVKGHASTSVTVVLPDGGLPEPLEIRVVRGFRAQGTVRDGSGVQIPGVRVTSNGPGYPHDRQKTTTDDKGSWEFKGLGTRCGIVFEAEGFATRTKSATFTKKHESPRRLDVRMDVGATIRGRVLDARGQPVAGTTVTVAKDKMLGIRLPSDITGEDGCYTLAHVPSGAWSVVVGATRHPVETKHGETYDVPLTLL